MTTFNRKERELLKLRQLGHSPKEIAYELEISLRTARRHLRAICRKAHIKLKDVDKYLAMNRAALDRGGRSGIGLHPPGCPCNESFCEGMRRAA